MFSEKLHLLRGNSLLRHLRDRCSPQGSKIILDGREYVNFSSNDYLGLANHPHIIGCARKSLDEQGFGAGASRLLSGGTSLHSQLEKKIAEFKDTASALLFNSGYAANTGVLQALADENTTLFSDEFNHASIIDGCRLSRAKTLIYRHKDVSHLKSLFEKDASQQKIVVTDTIFSMDGAIAPLKELYDICTENNALLYLDEAHATGVIGNGKGALAHFQIKPEPWIIQMGTCSKALGSFGAFLAGSTEIIEWGVNTARSLIFSTALPSCVIAATLAALEIIENDNALINKLWSNREKAVRGIQGIGYDTMGSETPIIPVRTGSRENTLRIAASLFEKGIFAPAIRPPAVKEARIRITVSASHTDEDIERLIEALKKA